MPYLIDSDVLIDISQGIKAAREYVDALTEEWGISQVSAFELIVGARDQRELAAIDAFVPQSRLQTILVLRHILYA
jgi:predicted nucleic acid-binding protein